MKKASFELLLAPALALFSSLAPARAGMMTLAPVKDGTVVDQGADGVFDGLDTTGDKIEIYYPYSSGHANAEGRGLFEFDLSLVPVGTRITSARLFADPLVVQAGTEILFLGYEGNGSLELADASAPAVQLGSFTSDGTSAELFGSIVPTLSASLVDQIRTQSRYLGLRAQLPSGSGARLYAVSSLEHPQPQFFPFARLVLEYSAAPVPEPSSLALACIGGLTALVCRWRRLRGPAS
jgi:hypothetical protein